LTMSSIIVTNVAPSITEQQISDFFSFCGKIDHISMEDTQSDLGGSGKQKSKVAKITFEKKQAAETALLLHDTKLGPTNVIVQADPSAPTSKSSSSPSRDSGVLRQEDKPRSTIMAEMLSYGYLISDKATEKSTEFDREHGVSSKFSQFLQDLDDKYKLRERASATDDKFSVSEHVSNTKSMLHRYFEKAMDTPTGTKVRSFYEDSSKSAADIHNEARRLADLRAGKKPEDQQQQQDQQQSESMFPKSSTPILST